MTRATALLLAIVCGQTYAATSDTICDRSTRQNLSLEIPANTLTVDVVDRGSADKLRIQGGALEKVDTFRDTSSFAAPDTARDAIILKRIFNEIGPDDRLVNDRIDELVTEDQMSDDLIDDLVDKKGEDRIHFRRALRDDVTVDLGRDIESTDDNVESAQDEADNNVPDINAHLPGVSLDESLRYRREMYRTDI